MKSFLSSIVLILWILQVSAFTVVPNHRRAMTVNHRLSLRAEPETAAEKTSPPPQPVKCPDCDMCDGSGRCV